MALPASDLDLLDRWLAILGLIDTAENLSLRRTGAWPAELTWRRWTAEAESPTPGS